MSVFFFFFFFQSISTVPCKQTVTEFKFFCHSEEKLSLYYFILTEHKQTINFQRVVRRLLYDSEVLAPAVFLVDLGKQLRDWPDQSAFF